jgi:hypothetical protein
MTIARPLCGHHGTKTVPQRQLGHGGHDVCPWRTSATVACDFDPGASVARSGNVQAFCLILHTGVRECGEPDEQTGLPGDFLQVAARRHLDAKFMQNPLVLYGSVTGRGER